MNKKLVVANWKMNPNTLREAENLFKEFKKITSKSKNVNTILCVPYPFLYPLKKLKTTTKFNLGAQNAYGENSGAFTGEVSVPMIAFFGAKYCIVGHSERRYKNAHEKNDEINQKIKLLLKNKITPILCVGEAVRDNNHKYFDFIKNQLQEAFAGLPKASIDKIIVAYEPVWAIGKDAVREATPVEINEMAIFIRKCISDIASSKLALSMCILYGGSVTANNVSEFIEYGGVDGFLVGRASLSVKDFTKIIEISNS